MIGDTINDAATFATGMYGGALGRIDKYELLRELGEGGFGAVYLARDTVAGIEVAVKGLPPEVKHNEGELEGIRANFVLVKRLRHPNIVAVTDLHPARLVAYASKEVESKLRVFPLDTMVVMDYAPGVTLAKWRRQFPGGAVPLDKALVVVRQIAAALDFAHKQRVLHRDVKPANVMVETSDDGRLTARVLDFGLAAEIRSSMGRVSREIRDMCGTRSYMAPEQWLGRKQGPATDQYALAVLFYELVVGDVPFASVFDCGDPAVMRLAVTTDEPDIPANLKKSVRRALAVALAKKPEERFASCGDFVDALEGKANVPRGGAEPRRGGGAGKAIGVFALLAALGAGGCYGWVKHEEALREYAGPKHGDRKTLTLPGGATMEMIYVGPGVFMMGSPANEDGRDNDETQHCVTLTKGYWLGKYEVTQRQWRSVMGNNPSRFEGDSNPVDSVSWKDSQEFIAKVESEAKRQLGGSARLPTEAEWEYACRSGSMTAYSWGNALNGDKANCKGNHPCGTTAKGPYMLRTMPVGSYAANAWGFYDMHGNVREWCQDWYDRDYYSKSPENDPCNAAAGDKRVLRGGGWGNYARICRSADRYWDYPAFGLGCGFRLCSSAGPRE